MRGDAATTSKRGRLALSGGCAKSALAAAAAVCLGFACTLAAYPVAIAAEPSVRTAPAPRDFPGFLAGLWQEANAAGISRATFDAAIKGLEPDLTLPDLELKPASKPRQTRQAEFARAPGDYLADRSLDRLAETGRALLVRHKAALDEIERRSGVDRYSVLAIFGRETAFGAYKLPHDAIRVLATQAWAGRRKDHFRKELIFALRMLEEGVPRARMRASWAGAMGLTQFLPSEFFQHAESLSGQGRPDLFTSVPDALASAARQLQAKGWVRGQSWGFEVRLPSGVDCAREGPPDMRPVRDWLAMGVMPAKGGTPADKPIAIPAYLMAPAGAHGPVFLVHENFQVIRRYNTSDLYATFVGTLADRIAGRGGFKAPFTPIGGQRTEVVRNVQSGLKQAGYAIDKIDGFIGSGTRREVGLYQRASGLKVDCWPSAELAKRLQSSGRRGARADGR